MTGLQATLASKNERALACRPKTEADHASVFLPFAITQVTPYSAAALAAHKASL